MGLHDRAFITRGVGVFGKEWTTSRVILTYITIQPRPALLAHALLLSFQRGSIGDGWGAAQDSATITACQADRTIETPTRLFVTPSAIQARCQGIIAIVAVTWWTLVSIG